MGKIPNIPYKLIFSITSSVNRTQTSRVNLAKMTRAMSSTSGIRMNRTRMTSLGFPSIYGQRFVSYSTSSKNPLEGIIPKTEETSEGIPDTDPEEDTVPSTPIQVYGGKMIATKGDGRDEVTIIDGPVWGAKYMKVNRSYDLNIGGPSLEIFPHTKYQACFDVCLDDGSTGWLHSTVRMVVQGTKGVYVDQPFNFNTMGKQTFTSGDFQGQHDTINFKLSQPHSDDEKTDLIIELFVVKSVKRNYEA